MVDPALAPERELDGAPRHVDVAGAERRDAPRAELLDGSGVADALEASVEQPDHRGERPALRVVGLEVVEDPPAEIGEPMADVGEAIEVGGGPRLGPAVVVPVLPAPGVVDTHGLQMPVRVGADPHLGPRGRQHQRLAPLPVGSPHDGAVRVAEGESPTVTPAHDARLVGVGGGESDVGGELVVREGCGHPQPMSRSARDQSWVSLG